MTLRCLWIGRRENLEMDLVDTRQKQGPQNRSVVAGEAPGCTLAAQTSTSCVVRVDRPCICNALPPHTTIVVCGESAAAAYQAGSTPIQLPAGFETYVFKYTVRML